MATTGPCKFLPTLRSSSGITAGLTCLLAARGVQAGWISASKASTVARAGVAIRRPSHREVCCAAVHCFALILAAKDWAAIFPFRTTNVSVANSYELSAVSAVQRI